MKNSARIISWISYTLLGIVVAYLTYMVITNTKVKKFANYYIDFAREEVGNYSALLSALVGLIGVILLIETFWLQHRQFQKEKIEKKNNDLTDLFNRLELFVIDLQSIKSDVESKSEKIKSFYEKEKMSPFSLNILNRSASRIYGRTLDVDRISVFRSFKVFVQPINSDWITLFNKTYLILDFLPEFFDDVYSKVDTHNLEQFKRKTEISEELAKVINHLSKLLSSEKEWVKGVENEINELIMDYQQLIERNLMSYEELREETNLLDVDGILKKFISNILEDNPIDHIIDIELSNILSELADLRRGINRIRESALEISLNLERHHKSLVDSNAGTLIRLENIITELKKAVLEDKLKRVLN